MILSLWLIFLTLLPTQLGKHWWSSWSLVLGIRVDYLSPTLFLTDMILVLLAGLVLWENRKSVRDFLKRPFSFNILLFIVYSLLSIVFSPRPLLSLYSLARYAQIPLVAWVASRLIQCVGATRFWRLTGAGLSITVLWTVSLSIMQMIAGKTIGFWALGERTFTVVTPGIASISLFGRTILRPYATFPHPNAMAGFLGVCFLLLGSLRFLQMKLVYFARILSGVGILLSASRLAIVSLVIASVVPLAFSRASAFIVFSPQSIEERLILTDAALTMIRNHPLFGVGPGQFLVELPLYLPRGTWLIQPVHNIPLLLFSEFGLVGSALIGLFVWKFINLSAFRFPLSPIFLFLLLTSLADHYWLTVQQNRILAGVVIGLWLSKATRGASEKRRADEIAPRLRRTS